MREYLERNCKENCEKIKVFSKKETYGIIYELKIAYVFVAQLDRALAS